MYLGAPLRFATTRSIEARNNIHGDSLIYERFSTFSQVTLYADKIQSRRTVKIKKLKKLKTTKTRDE